MPEGSKTFILGHLGRPDANHRGTLRFQKRCVPVCLALGRDFEAHLGPAGFQRGMLAILAFWEPILQPRKTRSEGSASKVQVASVVSSYFLAESAGTHMLLPPLPEA
jgi:hypothetical protein